jgi:hypothetical protein
MLASVLALATFTGRGQIPRLGQFQAIVGSEEEKIERFSFFYRSDEKGNTGATLLH